MKVFIGAENIISPLGNSAEENFTAICEGKTGIRTIENANFKKDETLYLAKFKDGFDYAQLLANCFNSLAVSSDILYSAKTKVIISSTKGYIAEGVENALINVVNRFVGEKPFKNQPIIISNACISGVLGIAKAGEMIRANLYENVIVIGLDFLSDFVTYGFEALFALSKQPIKPFDGNRKGINLGEGCAAIVLSKNEEIFNKKPLEYVSGSSSNDANHISGPSRTGEGLFRTINKSLKLGNVKKEEIGYISAHGTGTLFNDTMEAIAFNRLGLENVKLNSLKGYYGHTLGAAGLIEITIAMQQLRNQIIVKSLGFEANETDEKINVTTKTEPVEFTTFLKTASGFGGGNASVIIRKQ